MQHAAFYRFTPVADPAAIAQALRERAGGLMGSIVVAAEGVNGAVAGDEADVAAFEAALQRDDLLDGALRGMPLRRSACDRAPFGRLKVAVRPELVALALPERDLPPPDERDPSHVAPADWRALIAREDVVLLDNRSHFEVRLGRFRGALDPQVADFRDFVAYVNAHAPQWREGGRTVAMYCTGGIRCDKTAPWLRSLGLDVKQLEGGILNYLQQVDDAARDWQGECFVFDRRIALDASLRPTSTSAEQVFDDSRPDEAWRLQRARRLDGAS